MDNIQIIIRIKGTEATAINIKEEVLKIKDIFPDAVITASLFREL